MSSASREVWGARRPAIGWTGLTALLLVAACGGERRESASAGVEGGAVTDSAPTPSGDTATTTTGPVAPAAADRSSVGDSTAGATRDTGTREPAQPPAAPRTPTKPSKPAQPAAPKPEPGAAASAPDTAPSVQSETSSASQTATAPLRDPYHQAPKDTVDQSTYDGWKQYNLNCARCHGEDVMGTTIAPHLVVSLKPDGPINTQEAFVQVVCAGRPAKGMPSWCSLGMDPAKINQIYSYVKGRSDGKIQPGRPAVKQEG